ncbi:MAG: glycoside hydrolase family 25 protein [Candidatus Merdivicinus sp.]|jgi:GH25 family lysozyme M1 (1,4-beta-N-acetylmuramidase)
MEPIRPEKKRRGRGLTVLLVFSNLLLCLALAVTIFLVLQTERRQDERAVAAMAEASVLREDLEGAQSRIGELEETTIPIETFKGYAQQYGVSAEFIQRFFDDAIVYKDAGGIVYQPIDPELSKNSYDWSNLVRENGRLYYRPEDGPEALTGIDVSTHQGKIDWEKVAADGIDFAMIRLGLRGYGQSGVLKLDDRFEENLKGAAEAGLAVGVYFYSQAITVEEGIEEAELVLDTLSGRQLDFPVVFDQEEVFAADARTDDLDSVMATDIAIAFCDRVAEAGYQPMIYANTKWFIAQMDFSRLDKYGKWLAQYYRTPFFPYQFQMWQYTSTGTVDGIDGDVDLNLYFTSGSQE